MNTNSSWGEFLLLVLPLQEEILNLFRSDVVPEITGFLYMLCILRVKDAMSAREGEAVSESQIIRSTQLARVDTQDLNPSGSDPAGIKIKTKVKMESALSYPLSDKDIRRITENQYPIVGYDKLKDYSSLDQLLGKNGACIILYYPNPNSRLGHWATIIKHSLNCEECTFNNSNWCYETRQRAPIIEVFDAYGKMVDKMTGKYPHYLSRLISKSPYNVIYCNDIGLQSHSRNVSTCGRWACVRLAPCYGMKHLMVDDFASVMLREAKRLKCSPDVLVTLMTS